MSQPSAGSPPGLVQAPWAPPPAQRPMYTPPPPPGLSPAVAILSVVGLLVVVGAGIFLAVKHHGGQATVATAATPSTATVVAHAAPTPPPPVPGCTLLGRSFQVGSAASVGGGMTMVLAGTHVGLGWVVPPQTEFGGDDPAMVELALEGNVLQVIDPEERSRMDGMPWSPYDIARVVPEPQADGSFAVRVDAVERGANGVRTERCGPFYSVLDDASQVPAVPLLTTTCWCRSMADIAPWVLTVRDPGQSAGMLNDEVILGATRTAQLDAASPLWNLPISVREVTNAPDPMARLRSQAIPEGLAAVAVPGQGYAVVFRHHEHLYFGWIDPELHPRGGLAIVPTLGGEPGHPHLAWNGSEVLLVVADRGPTPPHERHERPEPPPYMLYTALLHPGEVPTSLTRLATTDVGTGHEFAPTATSFSDGSWAIAWSFGLLETHDHSQEPQTVYLRHYRPDLTPLGEALAVSGPEGGSDPAMIVANDHVLLAIMAGRGSVRRVMTQPAVCATPPAH